MKKFKWMAGVVLGAGMCLVSCTSVSDGLDIPHSLQKGELHLSLSSATGFLEGTRILDESAYRNVDNYTVQVLDKDDAVKLECKGAELSSKMPLTLGVGSFKVKAFYGEEKDASRSTFYVSGAYEGTIKAGGKETVAVTCTPTCGRVRVKFDEQMNTYFSDYKVSFTGTQALGGKEIVWNRDDTEPWYILLDEAGEELSFAITSTTKDEYVHSGGVAQTYTKTGRFKLSRNKGFAMKIEPNYIPKDSRSPMLNVSVVECTNGREAETDVSVIWN